MSNVCTQNGRAEERWRARRTWAKLDCARQRTNVWMRCFPRNASRRRYTLRFIPYVRTAAGGGQFFFKKRKKETKLEVGFAGLPATTVFQKTRRRSCGPLQFGGCVLYPTTASVDRQKRPARGHTSLGLDGGEGAGAVLHCAASQRVAGSRRCTSAATCILFSLGSS